MLLRVKYCFVFNSVYFINLSSLGIVAQMLIVFHYHRHHRGVLHDLSYTTVIALLTKVDCVGIRYQSPTV